MKNKTLFLTILSLVLLASCKDGAKMQRNSTGKPGETIVVVSKERWKGAVGDTIQKYLAQPQLSLPQEEPILDINNIPPDVFESFETTRNILMVQINEKNKESELLVQDNPFASPQIVVTIKSPSDSAFINYFRKNADRVIALFLVAERERLMKMYSQPKYNGSEIGKQILEKFQCLVNIPKGYTMAADTTDFAWIRYETPLTGQGIFIYTFPYESDSTFTPNYLVHMRDSMLQKFVPGPLKGSYMGTEHRIPVVFQPFKLNNNYSAEIRGLWKVEGDFMGGPFVSVSTLDLARKRVVTIEGYVYSPKNNKRNYLRQLEAMIYSIKFDNQQINDKLDNMMGEK